MVSKRALIIINGESRSGRQARSKIASLFDASDISVEMRDCPRPDCMSGLIRSCAATVDRVIIGGGDGTLNAALPALLATKLPLGIIPLGTGNDLARTLAIPSDFEEAAKIIVSGGTRFIDAGIVNGHPFFNVASLGLGVDLTRALTKDSKRQWGKLGYLVAGLRVLRRMRPFDVTVEIGGVVKDSRTIHLAVGNGRHYGAGMTVSEDAAIDDNRLDIYSLEVRSLWGLIKILPSLKTGRHGRWVEVSTMVGQSVVVRTKRPRSINADGEIITRTPAQFHILPRAIEVFAPNPSK